jgi:hypothetical protein
MGGKARAGGGGGHLFVVNSVGVGVGFASSSFIRL